ncbi:MAG: hypothetical protein KHW95_07705 [Firmicutes bacterium]|nr:hypothetical protein [Bacillota bacterium]
MNTVIAVARPESTDKTIFASCNAAAALNFSPHHIGFAAEGLTAINYQLLALRCGQQPLVGNRLARSAAMVLTAPKTAL